MSFLRFPRLIRSKTHVTLQAILFLFIVGSVLFETQAAVSKSPSKPVVLLNHADQCRKALDGSPKKKKFRHNWLNCIRRYERVYQKYPKSDEAAWALYQAGRLYTGLYRYSRHSAYLDDAIGLYKKLIAAHGTHRLADDAQYKIGEIYDRYKKEPAQAYVEFLKVDVRFPSGDMAPLAKKRLDALAEALNMRDGKRRKADQGEASSELVKVEDIRYWSTQNYTRVVVDLDGPVKYGHHLLKADPDHHKPRRLYLDLKRTRVPKDIDAVVPIKGDLLQRARAGQYKKDTVRVVLDIKTLGSYDVFHLYDPFRIVVDVRRFEEKAPRLRPELATNKRDVRKGIRRVNTPDRTVSLARQLGLSVQRIVIDPGHGGKDPGCHIGRTRGGVHEKDITLSIAKILERKLKKQLGCEVFLTRDRDTFLSLEQRTALANIKKADLFISLHVNAHKSRRIRGVETYFLNMATDKRAVMVAARENATSEKNISDLQTILNDLMLNTKIHESARLAEKVQDRTVGRVRKKYKGVRSLGVKQAPFYVLIGAQMPAILVEAGFLTNPTESRRLKSKAYQDQLAQGICDGVKTYIESIDQAYKGG
ncbi:MAG: N-acetylmuramoyl-L-alanine amidase [Deltaproteobacteria bacterium]